MNYIEENYGYITSSKLKAFMEDPEGYKLKYVDKLDVGDENADHFNIGTAFDFFVTHGRDSFFEEYEILEPRKKRVHEKQFTNSQGKVLLALMSEAERQPLFDINSKIHDYEYQYVIKKEFMGRNLKCTLDRVDLKNHIIEDTKTCQNIDHIGSIYKCPIKKFDYMLQASFYCLCYYVETGVFPRFYWNFFEKPTSGKDYSRFLHMECPPELMKEYLPMKDEKIEGIIPSAIKKLIEAEKEGFKSARDMYNDDGFGHLRSKYYDKSEGSIQKVPATYQFFCGNNDN